MLHAALGHLEPFTTGVSEVASYNSGLMILSAIHLTVLTVTAFPTSFHRADGLAISSATFVQFSGNPCNNSASQMSGVDTSPFGNTIAGGEGIPIVEPALSVGIAFSTNPNADLPSVQ